MNAPIMQFWGAAGTVTGSRFLVRSGPDRVLVDCGLFQGPRRLRERNWSPPSPDPETIDAVLLTHAHLDHCGYLPRLAQLGFGGPIYATPATVALASIVLPDSGHLQEEEAEYAGRKGYSRHHPALALYTEDDARAVLDQFRPTPFGASITVGDQMTARFDPAGHILGSALLKLTVANAGVVRFSGDLGRQHHPLLNPPAPVGDADWIVVESTYGARSHPTEETELEGLAALIRRTAGRGGSVIIPAFAVDRTEILLHHLTELDRAGLIPQLPIYVDSPMALAALAVYREGGHRDDPDLRPGATAALTHHPRLHEVSDVADSIRLNRPTEPCIIVSASGMLSGGRVVHHVAHLIDDPRNAVVLVGHQVEGTRGRELADGADTIKLLGRYVPVRAEVCQLNSLSAHADTDEIMTWLATAERPPEAVFVVHGEPESSAAIVGRIRRELGWVAVAPEYGEIVRLERRRTDATTGPTSAHAGDHDGAPTLRDAAVLAGT